MFSTLPAEIHAKIAESSENNDLIHLCLTSKLINERCLHVLYRCVDLKHRPGLTSIHSWDQMADARTRQHRFVQTLLSHPEYGRLVRTFKGTLCIFDDDICRIFPYKDLSHKQLWQTMKLLTHVQNVDVGTTNRVAYRIKAPWKQKHIPTDFYNARAYKKRPDTQLPNGFYRFLAGLRMTLPNPIPVDLFQSAASVRLVGHMQYDLAKSILGAVNPVTLKHLCLDLVQDYHVEHYQRKLSPGDKGDDGQIIGVGSITGLLTKLTGRCTALRTLILRRRGQNKDGSGWHAAAEEASYMEWASFIHSVQGSVEKLLFAQYGDAIHGTPYIDESAGFMIMHQRFHQFILPALLSTNWPCLTVMAIQGVRSPNDEVGNDALIRKLRAAVGENVEIAVEERAKRVEDLWEPNQVPESQGGTFRF